MKNEYLKTLDGKHARFNTGKVIHKLNTYTRKNEDGTETVIVLTDCAQFSPTFRGMHYRVTNKEVTCKKCLKLQKKWGL